MKMSDELSIYLQHNLDTISKKEDDVITQRDKDEFEMYFQQILNTFFNDFESAQHFPQKTVAVNNIYNFISKNLPNILKFKCTHRYNLFLKKSYEKAEELINESINKEKKLNESIEPRNLMSSNDFSMINLVRIVRNTLETYRNNHLLKSLMESETP
jgi:hypothetical protein